MCRSIMYSQDRRFFFFQAEDGIRDIGVTGVQTCALPIFRINNYWLLNLTYMKILITGGAGFIGSHVVRLFVTKYPEYQIVNLDKLTYAGNLENLRDIEDYPNYSFVKGDIVDADFIKELFREQQFSAVIHLAAESHVDRSITDPL